MKLSVVVPVLDEKEGLPELRRRLAAALPEGGEVVFVDDGSTDGTPGLLERFHAEDKRFKAVLLSRRFGHGAAVMAGLERACGDAVVLMDGDGQDPPELIAQLLAKHKAGAQVVYAERTGRAEGGLRRAMTWLFYRLVARVSDTRIPLDAGVFCLLDARAAAALRALPERHRYLPGLRAWIGFEQASVPYERGPRLSSTPKQGACALTGYAFDALFAFSSVPLRLATLLGLVLSLFSFAYFVKVLYEKLFTDKPIVGWTSTIATITLIGGSTLLTLGIIGEYLARIYDEVKRRPLYLEAGTIGF
jgi:glycosyltransferase involved in cell wall biosynthesis